MGQVERYPNGTFCWVDVGSYISVEDVDQPTGRARELGAEVLVEPFDTPGGGRVAMVRDPAGAAVSLSLFSATAVPAVPGRGVDGS
jgi:predicted enzyme related to lactoylglutathione lyase